MPHLKARRTNSASLVAAVSLVFVLVACSGPDDFGEPASSPIPSVTATPTIEMTPTPSATIEPTSTEIAEETATVTGPVETPADETPEAGSETATAEGTPDDQATPDAQSEMTSTPDPDTTPTQEALGGLAPLPTLEEMPDGGYIVADQGERSDEQLARAYADPTAHLIRLDEWGFRQHVYREFTRQGAEEDSLPGYVLATVNVYGSPEQADLAFQWLEELQLNQGARTAEAPQLGDASVAITIATAQGVPTASMYVRYGSSTNIYYAEGGDPLPEVIALAERVFERLNDDGRQAAFR